MSDTNQPTFRFKGRATGIDPEGYYYVNWGKAQPLSILATTKQEAVNKALALLGTHPRFGCEWKKRSGWTIHWDSIDEETTS